MENASSSHTSAKSRRNSLSYSLEISHFVHSGMSLVPAAKVSPQSLCPPDGPQHTQGVKLCPPLSGAPEELLSTYSS